MVFEDTHLKLTLVSEDVKSYYTVRQLELENLAVSMACEKSSRNCWLAFVLSPQVLVPAGVFPGIVSPVHSVAPHHVSGSCCSRSLCPGTNKGQDTSTSYSALSSLHQLTQF